MDAHSIAVVRFAGSSGFKIIAACMMLGSKRNGRIAFSKVGIGLLEYEEKSTTADPDNNRHEPGGFEHISRSSYNIVNFPKADKKIFQLKNAEDPEDTEYS